MNSKLVIIIAVLFIFALFIVQNAQVVMVSFLFWKVEASRAIVLMVTFVLGLFTGWILTQIFRKPKNHKSSDMQ
jgi:Na+/H+ antiporter NhaA